MTLESIDILKYKLYIGFIRQFDTTFSYNIVESWSFYELRHSDVIKIEKQCSLGTPHLVPLKIRLLIDVLFGSK